MDLVEQQHSELVKVLNHGLAVVVEDNPPTRDLDLILEQLEGAAADEPWAYFTSASDDEQIVIAELRDHLDAMSDDELVAQARAYGLPETTEYRQSSGYMGLLYRAPKPAQLFGHERIELEDWLSVSQATGRHLAPGTGRATISDHQIANLPDTVLARWAERGSAKLAHEVKARAQISGEKLPRLYFESFTGLQLGESRPELVQGFLDEGGLSAIVGAPKGGKTATLTLLAYCVASGEPFMGRKTRRALVVYVAAEGGNSTRRRFLALRAHFGLAAQAIPLCIVPCPVDLGHARDSDTPQLLNLIRQAEEEHGRKAGLVIVDTLARATPGMDENDAKGMGEFIANMDYIRAQTGAHVAVVHHFGKDKTKGGRGSSSLPAAVDSQFEVADGVITNILQRDRQLAAPIGFALQPVTIGHTQDGPVTSIVAVPASIEAKTVFKPVPPSAQKALTVLQDLGMNGRHVPLSEWRAEFVARHYSDKAKVGRIQFNRAFAALTEADQITEDGESYAPRC